MQSWPMLMTVDNIEEDHDDSLDNVGPEVVVSTCELVRPVLTHSTAVSSQGQTPVFPVGTGNIAGHVVSTSRVTVNLKINICSQFFFLYKVVCYLI